MHNAQLKNTKNNFIFNFQICFLRKVTHKFNFNIKERSIFNC